MSQPHNPKEERKMKLYGAIDLHSTNNVTVVIDEEDKIVYQKRLPNDLALILRELSIYQSQSRAGRARSVTQAQSDGASEDDQSIEHSESFNPQHRIIDEGQPGQRARCPTGR